MNNDIILEVETTAKNSPLKREPFPRKTCLQTCATAHESIRITQTARERKRGKREKGEGVQEKKEIQFCEHTLRRVRDVS
jgi:hypothetical protein